MATLGNKFNCFVQDLGLAKHNISSHAFMLAFTDTLPVATNTVIANITQIAQGGGYLTGGLLLDSVTWTNAGGISKLSIADEAFNATGNVAQFQYVVMYNSTASGGPLMMWWDYGSKLNLTNGEAFTTDFDQVNGVATFQ